MVKAFCQVIDALNERIGGIVCWLFVPLMLIVVMDVVLRYFFNKPQVWTWDVTIQLQGTIVVLGGAYVLLHKGHVAIDVLVSKLSPRKRLLIETVTAPFLIGSVVLLLWPVALSARVSLLTREGLGSACLTPIYPFKILMVVGVSALLLQGIAEFIRLLTKVVHGERAGK